MMEDMLRDFKLGEHLLLIGNQGVGKNKVADRFLQLLDRPRQYIQLHRDTTVQVRGFCFLRGESEQLQSITLIPDSGLYRNSHIPETENFSSAPQKQLTVCFVHTVRC